jgi:Fe-S-cluster-containing dehydrogenase component/DMSO reductase anchor subunit
MLLFQLLDQQQQLSAVDQFSRSHVSREESGRAAIYHSLMPASPPGPGQQYAFEVDLDRCSGCKACVTACHSLNGLDENETWRDVGLLVGGSHTAPVMQHVTAACHHCLQPACLIACPVNAYEKDPLTGIVKHLDDQCFGCQYCTLACPYEVPKYHSGKGIVRKCDMCSSRLAVGQSPACVQACPHQAIAIKVVDARQIIEDAETATFLPASPDPQITLPSTTYKTKRPFPRNLLPADYYRVSAQHAHLPLVVMLVLTQLSVGAFVVGLVLDSLLDQRLVAAIQPLLAANALGFGVLALASSTLHLGRPQYAFRAILGLRHSWLSREIVAFGVFAGLASAYAGAIFMFAPGSHDLPSKEAIASSTAGVAIVQWLGWSVAGTGTISIFCSIMIYVFTQRECWSFTRVALRFSLTAALLGVAAVWLSILGLTLVRPSPELTDLVQLHGRSLCRAVILLASCKLLWEAAILRHLLLRRMTPLKQSALMMMGELSSLSLARFALGVLGGIVMPAMLLLSIKSTSGSPNFSQFVVITGMLFVACLTGEFLERVLFFSTCATPRMPGAIR